jgi:hypothetical protein
VSSAKSQVREINFSAISLIYILNNRGPSTYPWGTPAETLQSEEDDLFDKVWHKGLIHKIKSYGVDSNLLNWFSRYLQDRQ